MVISSPLKSFLQSRAGQQKEWAPWGQSTAPRPREHCTCAVSRHSYLRPTTSRDGKALPLVMTGGVENREDWFQHQELLSSSSLCPAWSPSCDVLLARRPCRAWGCP